MAGVKKSVLANRKVHAPKQDVGPAMSALPVVGLFSYLDEDGHQELHCTGTLISPRVVLTSAECVYRHDTSGGGGRFLDLVGFTVLRTSDSTDHERQLTIAMQTTHALVVRAVVPRGWIRHQVCAAAYLHQTVRCSRMKAF
jgi:hypothetical protein